MDQFTKIFEAHKWETTTIGENSFVAENGVFAIFYSVFSRGNFSDSSMVCYLADDKDDIVKS